MTQMEATFRRMIDTIAYRQKALVVSEERYRELVEDADALVLKLDTDLCCMFVNKATEELFARPAADCIGRNLLDFIHPDDREATRKTLEDWVSMRDAHVVIDNRLLQASGKITHISWSFSIAYDYSGDPVYFRAIGRDVTSKKETEQALQLNEARYRKLSQEFEAVLEGIVDSLILFNPKREVVWANRGATDQFGLSQEQIRGRTCHQLWTGEAGGYCPECVQTVFASRKAFEGVRTTADGRTWGVKGYPIVDGSGHVINVIQIASDLTEKMTLREEATRAAHLAALGSLSAGVAHEINNPTGLILMSLPVVKAVFDDILRFLDDLPESHSSQLFGGLPYAVVREEVPQNLLDILGGAQRIRAIVEDLKNFARQEAQGVRELVDLGEVVERARRLLQNQIKNSTQHFSVDIEDDLPKVPGASQRLEQVVVNLLQNACHALVSEEQAIVVKVSADKERRQVTLQVRDEGVGIPAEIRDKITDPFFTTRRETGGTGLGLSVSARIINEHGGLLKIESEPGQGSTFTVELPAHEEDGDGN
jgi:PAS domain S-box-containing protein